MQAASGHPTGTNPSNDELRYPTLRLMRKYGVPLTRENYLHLNYMGHPPQQLDAEQEDELPEMFRLKA